MSDAPSLRESRKPSVRDLPSAPADPWDATFLQQEAADYRLKAALKPGARRVTVRAADLRLSLHQKGLSELSDEVVGMVREAAKRVTGGYMTFADMDIAVLEHLATRAVDAGLTDGLHPDVRLKAEALASARKDGSSPQSTD